MTQRGWILAVAVGLGASLLPGCVHTRPDAPYPYPHDVDESRNDVPGDSPYARVLDNSPPAEIAPPPQPAVLAPVAFKSASKTPDNPPQVIEPPRLGDPIISNAQELASQPAEEPVLTAMRRLLENRPADALQLLGHYEQPNQDIMIEVLPWMVRLAKGGSLEQASPKELTNLAEQVEVLEQALRERAALTIDKMCFCRRVKGFGEYEPLPASHVFRAGLDGKGGERMQIYVEVRNFSSREVESLHETRLASKVEIRDAGGAVEWRKDIPADPDRSLSPRHDYYFICYLPVPPDLPPGRHSLVVEVRDVTGRADKNVPPHRIARHELKFDVMAGDAAHAPRLEGRTASSTGGGGE
jgi:hypothetical protein